jgi:outer membrane protein assembly factor BamB
MNRLKTPLLASFVVGISLGVCCARADTQWPFYRHDAQLTARSAAVGNLTREPVELWSHYLGGWNNMLVVTHDKGLSSRIAIATETSEQAPSPAGDSAWHSPKMLDLAGDGTLVPALPGKVAKLLPDVTGLQQVIWEHPRDKPHDGVGRCYSFEHGASQPRLVWETAEEPDVYELLWTIADIDGDQLLDVIFMTHYRILVYDGQTGKKKSTLKWPIGRNYGQMTLADVDGDALPEVVVVADSPAHVDVLKYARENGTLLWSDRYITDEQVSLPIDLHLRVLPNHVRDVDADGRIEIVYNLFNGDADAKWHVIMRDALTGNVKYDLPDLFLWGLVDLRATTSARPVSPSNGDSNTARPMALCCLEAAGRGIPEMGHARLLEYRGEAWATAWQADRVRWQMKEYVWPLTEYSVASLGPITQVVPHVADVDGDGAYELFVTRENRIAEALGNVGDRDFASKWSIVGPPESSLSVEGTRQGSSAILVNVDSATGDITTSDCRAEQLDHGRKNTCFPLPARPLAIVTDMEGDGTNELVVQDVQWRTHVLRFSPDGIEPQERLRVAGGGLWLGRRWAGFPYSKFPVFTFNVMGDEKRELLLTDVSDEIVSTVTCLDTEGKTLWQRSLPDTPPHSIVWMAGGHFTNLGSLDLLVVVQSGSIGKCFCLNGDSGEIIWRMGELKLADGTPFNFGSHAPYLAVADMDGDGLDDICGQSGQYVAIVGGKDGKPLVTPRNMIYDLFPRWVNYGVNVVGDWDGSGHVGMFTNTTTNGFGLIDAGMNVKWFTDRDGLPLVRVGAVGRADGGQWIFGTIAETTFKTYDMKTGKELVSEDIDLPISPITTEVICADVDGDQYDEFLAVANNLLICFRADLRSGPRVKWTVRLPTVASELAFADADNDGHAEIIYTGTDGYVRSLGYRP